MKNTNIKKYQQGGGNTINPYRMPFSLFGDAGAMLGSIMAPIGATGSGFSERKTLGRNDYVLNWMKENNYEFAGRDWLGREMVLNKTTGKKERASDIGAPSDAEYTAYSQGNELFNKFLPLTQNMAGLFDLQQKERQELENKKDTVQDFPTNTSTYAPVGFMQDGGGTDPLYDKFPALKSIQSLPKGMSKKHKDMVLSTAFNETQQIAKDMMMQEIQSATYLDRLKKLFPNGAESEQQERLQNLQNTGTKFINFSPDENGYAGLYTPKDFSGKPLVEVTIPGVEPTTFFHEYGHASNKANLAPQEKSYIEKSLKSPYDPVELHAELGQLRQLAKILGVGNFDTNNISSDDVDALESALKNRNDNTSKKNLGVLQRLKKVTKDQNTLPDLFNTIAYNNALDKLPIARDGGLFRSITGKILYGGGDLDNLKDEISLDELNKAERDKRELINYINSDSYANRILNYAPPKIQKNPSKASEFVDEFRSRSLLGLDIPVMIGITDGAGEFKGSNIVVSKDYKKDFSNVVKHESGHAYTDPLRELQTGFIFANTKPYNNEVKSSPYAKGVNNRDDWNYLVKIEAPAVAHTIRAKMKEFFNIPLGAEITTDQYNEFIQEVNSNPEKYKFEKSQIDYLKTMAKNEASELNLINKLASSGNSKYMATMAKNGGFFQKLGKGIGNVFKGVGNVAHDWGLGVADSFGNRLGIYDIDNSKYKTNFGKDVSGFNDKLQSVTGKIGMAVASAAVPGLSGLSGLSGMAGGFNVPNNQQQYSPQQAVGMPSDFQILMGSLPGLLSGLQSPTQSNYTGFFQDGGSPKNKIANSYIPTVEDLHAMRNSSSLVYEEEAEKAQNSLRESLIKDGHNEEAADEIFSFLYSKLSSTNYDSNRNYLDNPKNISSIKNSTGVFLPKYRDKIDNLLDLEQNYYIFYHELQDNINHLLQKEQDKHNKNLNLPSKREYKFFQDGGNPQQVLGYKDISPYKNLPSQIINSNNITMDGVSRTLKLIPDVGQPVVAKGNSGNYIFPGARRVLEVPVAQDGTSTMVIDGKAFLQNWINSPHFINRLSKNLYELESKNFDNKYDGFLDKYVFKNDPTEDANHLKSKALDKIKTTKEFQDVDGLNSMIQDGMMDKYEGVQTYLSNSGVYLPGQHATWFKQKGDEPTRTHEYTHASGLDKVFKYLTPSSAVKDKINSRIKLDKDQYIDFRWDKLSVINSDGKVDKNKTKKVSELLNEYGISQEKLNYIENSNEVYPRIMEIRYENNIKPGEIIDNKKMKSIIQKSGKNHIFEVFSEDQIMDMLNKFAAVELKVPVNSAQDGGQPMFSSILKAQDGVSSSYKLQVTDNNQIGPVTTPTSPGFIQNLAYKFLPNTEIDTSFKYYGGDEYDDYAFNDRSGYETIIDIVKKLPEFAKVRKEQINQLKKGNPYNKSTEDLYRVYLGMDSINSTVRDYQGDLPDDLKNTKSSIKTLSPKKEKELFKNAMIAISTYYDPKKSGSLEEFTKKGDFIGVPTIDQDLGIFTSWYNPKTGEFRYHDRYDLDKIPFADAVVGNPFSIYGRIPKGKYKPSIEYLPKDLTEDDLQNNPLLKIWLPDLKNTGSREEYTKYNTTKLQDGGQPTNNNEEMIMGVIEMLQSVEDLNNRERMAIQKLQELKQEGIDIDEEDFMEAVMEEDYDDVNPEDFDDDSFEVEDEIEVMKDGGMPQRYKDMGFSKVDTPRRTPKHKTKSHAVVIKDGGKYKLIRFGQQGVSGSPKRKGESKADANRRKSFKARHAKNISKGKTSAAFWSSRIKW